MSVLDNSPLSKRGDRGLFLGGEDLVNEGDEGVNSLSLHRNFFRLEPDNFAVTPDNNRIAGLFMAHKSFLNGFL